MNDREITRCLTSILAPDAVSSRKEDIAIFSTANPVVKPGASPTHVARPANEAELAGLVALANKYNLNLTVSSSDGPHCRGGLIADHKSVMVDLSPWDKVLWINRRNRVCQIQTGVSYGQLLSALKPLGMTISMPLAPRSGKSVLTAVMDRTPSTWPNKQWDISDPVASTEFIFGNGAFFRTGAAGGPGTIEQQRAAGGAQKCSLGPSQTDFHRVIQGAQGIMGIVTWITMRTELLPSIQKPYLIGADALDRLVPFMFEVQRPWLGEHSFILNRTALAMLFNSVTDRDFEPIRKSLPTYICLQNIAGFTRFPKQRVKYQRKDIADIAGRCGLAMKRAIGEVSAEELMAAATSTCGETDWRHTRKGHCLSIFFLTKLDRVSGLTALMSKICESFMIDKHNLGIYIQPVVQNHGCHVEFMIPFNPEDDAEINRMTDLEINAVNKLSQAGVFFSRPYGAVQDTAFKMNPQNTSLLKKIKTIFDPNRILNRGKWNL